MAERHIVAMGGGGFSMEPRNPRLDDFVLSLARRKGRPRICFVGTASGDSDTYITRFHAAFPPSRAAATHLTFFERTVGDLKAFVMDQDVIYVGGGSAGATCWFEDGLTDSFGMPYRRLNDGLGFVRGACCPHYDGEKERRPVLLRLIKRGFPSTLALDDGAGAHFAGTRLIEVVSSRPKARAIRVELSKGDVIEKALPVRYLAQR